jgi:hypothetical protein
VELEGQKAQNHLDLGEALRLEYFLLLLLSHEEELVLYLLEPVEVQLESN